MNELNKLCVNDARKKHRNKNRTAKKNNIVKKNVHMYNDTNEKFSLCKLSDDNDGAHLKSFGIEFQTEKAKERAPSIALLCACL